MSVGIAVRRNGTIAVAGDGLITTGNMVGLSGRSKVEKRGDAIVAISGTCGHDDALRRQLFGVIDEYKDDWANHWPEYSLGGEDKSIVRRLAEEGGSYLLVVYGSHLYHVHPSGSVSDFDQDVLAIGCGAELAVGAATALLDERGMCAEFVARRAAAIACQHDAHCGGSIICETIEYEAEQ